MSHDDVITLAQVARKATSILPHLPTMLKGLRISNDTDPQKTVGLGWAIEQAARHNPHGAAVLYQDQRHTYTQFNQWSNRIAHYFLAQGFAKGDVVAVFIENRPELLATVVGLAKIGVVAALVNTSQRDRVLTHSINLVKPRAVIVGDELITPFREVHASLAIEQGTVYWFADQNVHEQPGQEPEGTINLQAAIEHMPVFNPATSKHIHRNDGLFYVYTSGTTGLPKAAIFTHGRWMKAYGAFGLTTVRFGKHDVLYTTMPMYHATAMVVCWGSCIAGSAGIAIRRKFSAREFWNDIRRYNATSFGYVGELCRYLMELPASEMDREHKVRKIIGNGLRPGIWKPFKQRFGIEEVLELYASSEGNVGFTNIFNFDNTVGFSPMPYCIVAYDKDSEQPARGPDGFMRKVQPGEAGLLIAEITDKTPFDGYTDPAKNEACILRDVFAKGDRYFNTGDLLRDIGFRHAQFVDRTGDTFRWKGENVSTTEVENIMGVFGQLVDAVVYGVEIPGTNGRAGMAAITPREGIHHIDYAMLYEYLRKELPPFAVPVFLRLMKKMETTGTFKYQKVNLKKEGFEPSKVQGDPLLVCLPGTHTYTELTEEIYTNIVEGHYRF